MEQEHCSPGETRWEYRVIRLNIEQQNTNTEGSSGAATQSVPQPFSRAYLEHEFPKHYDAPEASTTRKPSSNPTHQLQDFLNHLGNECWQLDGIYPIGNLLMMVLSRPLKIQARVTGPQVSDGTVVDPSVLARLSSHPKLSTTAAAAALGFRSAASLANLGTRLGYPEGMTKCGTNDKVALYIGREVTPDRRRSSQHTWVVVDQAQLVNGALF